MATCSTFVMLVNTRHLWLRLAGLGNVQAKGAQGVSTG
jgi:hypothetical protein